MVDFPVIKAQYQVKVKENDGVFLLSEYGNHILVGKPNELVVSLIDGKRSSVEIAQLLEGQLSKAEVYFTIGQLEKSGFIVDVNDSLTPGETAFWNYLGTGTAEVKQKFENYPLDIVSLSEFDEDEFKAKLLDQGFKVSNDPALTLVLVKDYLQPEFLELNKSFQKDNISFLPIKIDGGVTWMGPIINPAKSPCIHCIASRLRGNRSIEGYLKNKGETEAFMVSKVQIKALVEAAFNMVLLQLNRHVGTGSNPVLEHSLITFDQINMQPGFHPVTKRPQCPVCGSVEDFQQKMSGPVILNETIKNVTHDGGHRATNPAHTYEKFKHHVSPITGVVEYLRPGFHSNASDPHSYLAGHNFAMETSKTVYLLKQSMRSVSGGKGATEVQARTSALCEALERFSGVYQGEEPRIKSTSFHELGDKAMHPNDCMLFSNNQYENRQAWLNTGSPFKFVPVPFDPDSKIDWSPVWSLTNEEHKYLPTAYLFYNYPQEDDSFYSFSESNGNAAGNTVEEAILQGFFELIERDSVCLWWYNRLKRPMVDLDSFNLPIINNLRNKYRELGREFWVLDLMFDFPIPAFVSLSRNMNSPIEEIVMGFGAHFDPKVALSRAVTEMNQFLPWVEATRMDNGTFHNDTTYWMRNATISNQPYLMPLNVPPRKVWDYPNYSHPSSITQDVLQCKHLVESKNMEMLVLDQTRPDIGLNVVKVIVPGLRHFWARYAPGRMYDIPFELGLLPKKLEEHELNPISVFV